LLQNPRLACHDLLNESLIQDTSLSDEEINGLLGNACCELSVLEQV
jgi:hypothetical protein